MPPRPEKQEVITFPPPPGGRAVWLAGVLRQRLWGGAYRPHQWIRENSLRTEFGLSNGPVREALQLLVAEGLLERVPYCGIRVCALSDHEVVELFQVRLALLELAAELAARRVDPAALARGPSVLEQVRHNMFVTPGPAPGHLTGWVLEASGNLHLMRSWPGATLCLRVGPPGRRSARDDKTRRRAHRSHHRRQACASPQSRAQPDTASDQRSGSRSATELTRIIARKELTDSGKGDVT
jgi:DNA-binding FadR family transcriptional regulator